MTRHTSSGVARRRATAVPPRASLVAPGGSASVTITSPAARRRTSSGVSAAGAAQAAATSHPASATSATLTWRLPSIARRIREVRCAREPSLGISHCRASAEDALRRADHGVAVAGLGLEPLCEGSALDVLEYAAETRGHVLAVDLQGACEPSEERGRAVVPGGSKEPGRPEAFEHRFHLAGH